MINSLEIQSPNHRLKSRALIQSCLYLLPPLLSSLLLPLPPPPHQVLALFLPASIVLIALWYARYKSLPRPRFLQAWMALSVLSLGLALTFKAESKKQTIMPRPVDVGSASQNLEMMLRYADVNSAEYSALKHFRSLREYEFKEELSVVIVIRDEEEFIQKTIEYTLQHTPDKVLREIVIVDDASAQPAQEYLTPQWLESVLKSYAHRPGKLRIFRFNQKQGLIRAKIAGAELSVAANIFFLDGHCRPEDGWHKPLLDKVNPNLKLASERAEAVAGMSEEDAKIPAYKRVVIPQIFDIDRFTWEDKHTYGLKMMFDWTFEFDWMEDDTNYVPILPGGIELITRKWWEESGGYDSGMLEWGGENIEQSLRVWLCGGMILQTSSSRIGHIFSRPAKPNPNNELVRQVQKNQKRAAIVWLDDYYQYLERFHTELHSLDPGPGLEYRQYIRSQLQCKPFRWFVQKFKSTFQRRGLLIHEYHHIQSPANALCLTAVNNRVSNLPCVKSDNSQLWSSVLGGRMIHNLGTKSCLTKVTGKSKMILAECRWVKMLRNENHDQFWHYDNGTIFTQTNFNTKSPDGNDQIRPSQRDLCLNDLLQILPCASMYNPWHLLW